MSENLQARHSRYLSFLNATTIGANATVGAGVFLIIGLVFGVAGRQTPLSYFLSLFFFLPIVLTTAERVLADAQVKSLLHNTRLRSGVSLTYTVGWLMLGGLILLGALLAWGLESHLRVLLTDRFGVILPISGVGLAVLLFLAVTLNRYLGLHANWNRRRAILVFAILLLVFIVIRTWLSPPQSISGYAYLPPGNRLDGLPEMAAALWGLVFITQRTHQIRRPQATLLPAMILSLGLMAAIGGGTAALLITYPRVVVNNVTPIATLAVALGPVTDLFLLLAIVLIFLIVLDQVVATMLRLVGEMIAGGYIPQQLQQTVPGREFSLLNMLAVATLSVIATLFLTPHLLITGASIAFLLMTAIIHLPQLFQTKSPLPADRPLRLPFYPLLPIATVIICLSLVIARPVADSWPLLLWVGAGALLFVTYGRRSAIAVRRRQEMIIEAERQPDGMVKPRLLVAVANPATAQNLVFIGAQIAQARGHELLILHVVLQSEVTPGRISSAIPPPVQDLLNESLAGREWPGLAITPMVRLAPTVVDGIQATIWEEKVDTLLLGWPAGDEPELIQQEGIVDQLVRLAACEVLVLHGQTPERLQKVLVPLISEAHAPAALALGQEMVQPADGRLTALQPVAGQITPESETAIRSQIAATINRLPETTAIEQQVLPVDDLEAAIVAESEAYDLTILGVSGEGFLAQTLFGGLPVAIAEAIDDRPVLLVKHKESPTLYLARQVWERLAGTVPNISYSRQKEVSVGMTRDARAGIDFYILIILSASIAFLGLLQNSAAVIIGAMLVAPLMSPILALAFGIVRGKVTAIRQAANSTVNGVVLAIALPTLISFFLGAINFSNLDPTSEILARTQPGLLDLMVALLSGAAAAYAVSRAQVAAALPGVAIAAALVPPLAVVGYGLGTARFEDAFGAMLLFLTNLAAIVLSGAFMFLLLGFRPPIQEARNLRTRQGLQMALLSLVVISTPLLLTALSARADAQREQTVRNVVQSTWRPEEVEVAELSITEDRREVVVALTLLDYVGKATTHEIAALQALLAETLDEPVLVQARVLNARLDSIDENTILPTLTPTPTPTLSLTLTITPSATIAPTQTPVMVISPTLPLPAGEPPTLEATASPVAPPSPATMTVEPDPTPNPTPEITPVLSPTAPAITVTVTLTATASPETATPELFGTP